MHKRSYRKRNLRKKPKKEAKRKMLEASRGIVKAEKRTRCKMNQGGEIQADSHTESMRIESSSL